MPAVFRHSPALLFAALLAFAFAAPSALGRDVAGRVVGVHDGDSITLLVEGRRQLKVRLEGIDAPEHGQAFSRRAQQALAAKVHGKDVVLRVTGEDRYGRTLGTVFVGEENVSLALVREGLAWHFKRYSNDRALAEAEKEARTARRGIWSEAAPVAPWDYRASKRAPREGDGRFWLNTGSGVRHNSTCRWFGKTARGRACGPGEGRGCGECGG